MTLSIQNKIRVPQPNKQSDILYILHNSAIADKFPYSLIDKVS
jgi:hypothetical protein